MRIYLTGFMGAGKTSVGRTLSERLGLPFSDLDEEIERRTGTTVREIFERSGEPEFRRLELETLAELVQRQEDLVLATGGGTPAAPAARRLLGSSGVLVWLNTPFATIVERIGALGKETRPLFRDEVQAFELYRSRLPAYRASDVRVDVTPGETPEEVAARVALLVPCAT
jgi:shikimate kinase